MVEGARLALPSIAVMAASSGSAASDASHPCRATRARKRATLVHAPHQPGTGDLAVRIVLAQAHHEDGSILMHLESPAAHRCLLRG
jgi:hypothetical protein